MIPSTAIASTKSKSKSKSKFFTISFTKAELDLIQKQFLEEMDRMLDKLRRKELKRYG